MLFIQVKLAIFVLCAINIISCNDMQVKNRMENRIVGGTRVKNREDFPYQVSLRFRGQHICGGTIYKKHYVISAAHCLDGFRATDLEVVAGDLHLKRTTSETQRIRASSLIIHENYTRPIGNDVGVIKLKNGFKFNKYVKAVPIWNSTRGVDGKCFVSGWGAKYYDGPVAPDMNYAKVKIFSSYECSKIYSSSFVPPSMLCAGDLFSPKDACSGDSGGPLLCNGNLYGIVSWGIDCGQPHFPGVYTNASHFLEWINAHTNFGAVINPINVFIPFFFILILVL